MTDTTKGLFIVFEGIDGAGKSLQITKVEKWFQERQKKVVVTREPGGTALGEQIRKLLLRPGNKEMIPITELLLYAADRAQHVQEVIEPRIRTGDVVLCDRYTLSTVAYQGYGRHLDQNIIAKLNDISAAQCRPDLTFFLDVNPAIAKERLERNSGRNPDRLEQEQERFFTRIRQGYLNEAGKDTNVVIIDGNVSPEGVFQQIQTRLEMLLWSGHSKKN